MEPNLDRSVYKDSHKVKKIELFWKQKWDENINFNIFLVEREKRVFCLLTQTRLLIKMKNSYMLVFHISEN